MKGGTLEVLLVDAEGRPSYYVIIKCGNQEYRSKQSSGEDEKVSWNEKITFKFPLSNWKKLTHLKLRIMDTELFTDAGFVGETMIHLGGIVTEGKHRGFIELKPLPYNVVLEDDTYKGETRIGFRFTANKERQVETREFSAENTIKPRGSICRSIANLWRILWWTFLFCHRTDSKSE
ncbi:elicitor-responsive protein 3 [Pyrus ussuriensis x Pyrus communis]|uniref:Elicitor-responsive protein 3 n=1 Tax=Pyrus ussuriensis x Pyrus communis TaxID=2448454 RepID=A0A5N5G3F8_9ROSA|nr:elicitor-responsive protein 3 [Pyrus ussuriensis x Pyrus communis]